MLFAFYDKHNGNMTAISRDRDCQFKAYNQIRFYARFYHFDEKFVEIRRKRAEEVVRSLPDAKMEAIQRARDLIQVRQVPIQTKEGTILLDEDGRPIFYEVHPTHKDVKAAWEILKTELGEPTTISKSEVNNTHDTEVQQALDIIANLAHHGKPQTDREPVQGKPEATSSTTETPPTV